MKDEFIKTNIKLPREQWKRAKQHALALEIPLWELLSQGLELRMKQERKSIYGKQMFEEISGKKKV